MASLHSNKKQTNKWFSSDSQITSYLNLSRFNLKTERVAKKKQKKNNDFFSLSIMIAAQNSQEQRSQKLVPSSELLASPVVVVTAKKNLFEAGEAGIQSPSRAPGCKARRTFLIPAALWLCVTLVQCFFDLILSHQMHTFSKSGAIMKDMRGGCGRRWVVF